jgi:predicted DNA-binding antitoxin AbrB/MazE fold protein
MTTVEAIYEGGVFKPLGEVNLAERQRVKLVIQTDEPAPRRGVPVEQVLGMAAGQGPPPDDETVRRWIDEYRMEKYGR